MANKSTTSNNSENTENTDSSNDSEESGEEVNTSQDEGDAPVVIDGEAEDITEPAENDKAAPSDTDAAGAEAEADSEEHQEPDPPAVVPPPAAEPKRASVWPLIFGGLVAGAIGFFAANLGMLNPAPPPPAELDTSAIDARIDELSAEIDQIAPSDTAPLTARIDALSADVQALQDTPAPTFEVPTSVTERLEALEADLAEGVASLNERFAVLESQLADLQVEQETTNAAADMSEDELAAFEDELEQLTASAKAQVEEAKAQVEEARARASELEIQAAEAAAVAERKEAIAALTAAVENGNSFNDQLAVFETPPAALVAAQDGVATLSALQRDFPDAARDALSAASEVPQEGSATTRLRAFLKRQTNARSLAPKDGDDVDAILSRAESSVLDGDLAAAMTELSDLPEDAKEAMQPWLSQAQARLDALNALSELTAAEN